MKPRLFLQNLILLKCLLCFVLFQLEAKASVWGTCRFSHSTLDSGRLWWYLILLTQIPIWSAVELLTPWWRELFLRKWHSLEQGGEFNSAILDTSCVVLCPTHQTIFSLMSQIDTLTICTSISLPLLSLNSTKSMKTNNG